MHNTMLYILGYLLDQVPHHYLIISYLLLSDAFDLRVSSKKMGKNKMEDIKEGKVTITILIHYYIFERVCRSMNFLIIY